MNQFFLDEFDDIFTEPDFLQMEFEKINEILSSDKLVIREESTVFEFIVNWVNFDVEKRKELFPQLFKHVRLQFIAIEYVAEIVRLNKLVKEIHECRDLVEEAFAYHVLPNVFIAQKHRKCFAPEPDSVMLLPYQERYQAAYNRETKKWSMLSFCGLTSTTIRKDCAVATNYPITILCGGINKKNEATNQVVRFDSARWMKMPPMKEARCGAGAAFYEGKLFVFGGETYPISSSASFSTGQANPDASNFSSTFEIFDKKWESNIMEPKRSYFAAQFAWGKIFLIGGYSLTLEANATRGQTSPCKEVCKETVTYCPEKNTWENCGQLNEARASFGCETLPHAIVVVGGIGANKSSLTSFEFYAKESEQSRVYVWTILSTSNLSRRGYSRTDFGALSSCLIEEDNMFVADSRYRWLFRKKLLKKESWSEEAQNCPAYGKLIPFSSWFSDQQTFASVSIFK